MKPSPQEDFDAWVEATHDDGMTNVDGDLNALVPIGLDTALRCRLDSERCLFGLTTVTFEEISEELREEVPSNGASLWCFIDRNNGCGHLAAGCKSVRKAV